ncbi:MAG: DedA family protein [Flammeovirgaceae bacterium]|jgi:membrane protein DedA with SNARE-associated domain|nr:DedA family protein [Flammeovirgaceae bacterium]
MENFLDQYGYLALLVGTFFEGETAILMASSLIYRGLFDFHLTILAAFLGSFISDWIYYLIGRLNGKYFLAKRPKLKAKVMPVTNFFHKHKLQILLSYRFLYGFRIIIPLVVGMSGIRPITYLFYSTLAGLLWATLVSTAGYWVGRLLNLQAKAFEDNFIFIVLGFATFGLLMGYLIRKVAMRRMAVE